MTAIKTGTSCEIMYTPDPVWFGSEARVFPILLDPSITTNEYVSNIQDTYVEENSTVDHSSEQYLYVYPNGGNRRRAVIRITSLPVIDEAMPIVKAELALEAQYAPFSTVFLNAHYLFTGLELSEYSYFLASGPYEYTTFSMLNQGQTRIIFDLTNYIYSMYNDEEWCIKAGYDYYGDFIIDYANSTDTTFLYPFCSSESTAVESRPVLTVKYGYSLPAGILDGQVYSFQNVAGGGYMTVTGVEPANNSNVYQLRSTTASTRQKFKLEYVSATGGYLLRSMSSSSGTDKVVDIQRSGGAIYSGRNVQIYAATDPISQEWLIVPVNDTSFRLVPRANMSLALTVYGMANGSSTGKTATSPGNIFVQTIDKTSQYQLWEIYDSTGIRMRTSLQRAQVETGNYYLSNAYIGSYLHRSGSTVNCMRGLENVLGANTIRWQIVNLGDGYCTIQRADVPHYYLAPISNAYGSGVKIYNHTSETIPEEYKWSIQIAIGGGCLIRNKVSGYYLHAADSTENPSEVYLRTLQTVGTNGYKKQAWRIRRADDYRELTPAVQFADIVIDIGRSRYASISTNAHWADYDDFEYEITSGGNYVTYNATTNSFTGQNIGTASVTAMHKTTGLTRSFNITVTKKAIIIIPGIMGSQIFASESITIPSDSITDASNTFAAGTRLWDPSSDATQLIQLSSLFGISQ